MVSNQLVGKLLTNVLENSVPWRWVKREGESFKRLQDSLVNRLVLALYSPNPVTEVDIDATMLGLGGILLQVQPDERLYPVANYSRQTTDGEQKNSVGSWKSEEIPDIRVLATSLQKQIIPRIVRWWLQFQEFTFEVKYRPGARMAYVDCLSRIQVDGTDVSAEPETVFGIEQADWVSSCQFTDESIKRIHEILSRAPSTEEEKQVYKNYALRDTFSLSDQSARDTMVGTTSYASSIRYKQRPQQIQRGDCLPFGYGPRRGADMTLKDEVSQIPTLFENLITARK
nr:unnamed protein product [Callosobruchus analis]